jgi:hypothetical protein
MKTQGEMEAAICEGISRFEQEYRGRGTKDIHAYYTVRGIGLPSRDGDEYIAQPVQVLAR